ncbi:MAG: zinc ribbon domain-containing protein [Xanthomonadaceae bacterium]|nr:zinc ribbon domain-containing protein [Xanthomonadaceae bacterium]MDP2186858.1 zinc ribbon domain-containing protein [Xanthomonadales bacterium]MDZ4114937.1 zinc ribbon domain-containing protein [Xanthomonadaceae bacterium]MDZ4377445.1 zinc ribbon domain-containing protein [Xanthomonadaceae bacterium]
MAYEYSSTSRRLDVPNPLRSENVFLFAAAAILLAAAVYLLMISRGAMAAGNGWWSAVPLVVGVILLVRAILKLAKGLGQLRFFFGRGQPVGLADELGQDQAGISEKAADLRETLRQNALTYAEPQGALSGLLFSWIPDLIFAPAPIQQVTQRQFQTALALLATALSWAVSMITLSDPKSSAWSGLFYFLFATFLLVKPLDAGIGGRAQMGMRSLVGLVLLAMFGPVLIPSLSASLPDIGWLRLNLQTGILMASALLAVALFFVALMRQLNAPPPTTMAREQLALSFNAHPKQLLDELDRLLQANWSEQIPNRRYAFEEPQVGSGAGSFRAELIEETQPLPRTDMPVYDLAGSLASPRYRWLVWLDVAALAFTIGEALGWVAFAHAFDPAGVARDALFWASLAIALLVVARFCFNAAHVLWLRFDFLSEIIWVEMSGNYQAADFEFGAQFTDRVKSKRQVINIETMTLRVWVAELETVNFGKQTQRWLIGMRGLRDKARMYAEHLTDFAGAQSIIVAPTAAADVQKVAAMSAMNKLAQNNAGTASLPQPLLAALTAAGGARFCHSCGSGNETDARFCGQCGTGLEDNSPHVER